jgi:hypothetical protein
MNYFCLHTRELRYVFIQHILININILVLPIYDYGSTAMGDQN